MRRKAAPNRRTRIIRPKNLAARPAPAPPFSRAEDAFQAGKYRDAVRMANHAAVESPRNPKAAELMSLALFADGDYRSAAAQAHAALTLGPVTTWNTLRGYYGNDVESYTTQLRRWKSIATINRPRRRGISCWPINT